jgi:hypothetical protein
MSELKTLKDIKPKMDPSFGGNWYVNEFAMKQEAIKHIKADQKLALETFEKDIELHNFQLGRMSFAKEFCNITEEDLKDGS